jgi:hypothetical protein
MNAATPSTGPGRRYLVSLLVPKRKKSGGVEGVGQVIFAHVGWIGG